MTDSQVYYLDTRALVKRYAREDGSDRVRALCEGGDSAKVIGHVGLVEQVGNSKNAPFTGGETEVTISPHSIFAFPGCLYAHILKVDPEAGLQSKRAQGVVRVL